MKIYLTNSINFKLDGLSNKTINKLEKHFRVKDPEYIKSNDKRSYDEEDKYIPMCKIKNNRMYLPRGVFSELEEILSEEIDSDEIEIVDKRLLLEEVDFPKVKFELYPHQKKVSKLGYRLSQGTFQAGCGSGKTIALINLITLCRQPALIIVPDTALQKQWLENIQNVLGYKYKDRDDLIGLIGEGNYDYKNKAIVIATNQSIYSHRGDKELFKSFGFVAMDECHVVGARTFRTSIHMFHAYYRFGATATLFRNDNLGCFIEDYIGKCFYVVTDDELESNGLLIRPNFVKRPTNFYFKVDYKYGNWYTTMCSYMFKNMARNKLIVDDIISKSVNNNRIALVVSTRVNHCVTLAQLLQRRNPKLKIGILIGQNEKLSGNLDYRNIVTYDVESKARKGEIDIIFGVDKVKQGLDIPPIEDVYIVMPRKSQVDVTQIVGRAMRPSDCFGKYKNKSDKQPCIYDYVDVKIDVLKKQFEEWRMPIYEQRCIIQKEKSKTRISKKNHKNGKSKISKRSHENAKRRKRTHKKSM